MEKGRYSFFGKTILVTLLDEAATRQNDSFDETGINFS